MTSRLGFDEQCADASENEARFELLAFASLNVDVALCRSLLVTRVSVSDAASGLNALVAFSNGLAIAVADCLAADESRGAAAAGVAAEVGRLRGAAAAHRPPRITSQLTQALGLLTAMRASTLGLN